MNQLTVNSEQLTANVKKPLQKPKKTKKKLEIWPGGARDARLISSIFFGFFGDKIL